MKKFNFESCLKPLDTPQLDALDGKILPAGAMVIYSPLNPGLVVEDTPENRKRFLQSGCVWDEPTRILRVKELVNQLSARKDYGNIRTVDIAYELCMSVAAAENVFHVLVQQSDDYFLTSQAVDSQGKPCLSIEKKQ